MRAERKKPVRKIGRGHRGIRGHASILGLSIAFESTLEHDFLTILSLHPALLDVVEQPTRVRYRDADDVTRWYTPDFLASFVTGPGQSGQVLFEIKYRDELARDWMKLRPKLRAGVGWARAHGARFCVMTDAEIRTPVLENARLLKRYRTAAPDSDLETAVVAALSVLDAPTIDAVARHAVANGGDLERAHAQVLRLIAVGRLRAPLREPLGRDTPILLNPMETTTWPPLSRAFVSAWKPDSTGVPSS